MISLSGWSPSCTLSALRRRVYRSHRRAKNNTDARIPALHGSRATRETGEWLSPLLLTRSHFSRSFCLVSAGFGFLIRHSTISGHIWKIKVCSGRVVLASVVMPLSIETPPYLSYSRRRLLQVVSNRRRSCHRNVTELSQSPWCRFSQPGLQYQERASIREAGISLARRCST
jgi:hypothetical protein